MKSKKSTQSVLTLTQLGVLSALIILLTFVPNIGYISYGVLSITIIHIPVIIGAIVMGPKSGAILGAVWGISCIVKAVLAPPSPLEGAIFWNPAVSLIPRVLAGFIAGAIFVIASKADKVGKTAQIIAAVIAALLAGVAITSAVSFANQAQWAGFAVALIGAIVFALIIAGCLYLVFAPKKEDAKGKKNNIPAGIAAIAGCITNTIFVMGAIYIFHGGELGKELGITVMSFGGFLKYVLAAFTINAVLEIVAAVIIAVPVSMALKKVKTRV